MSTRATSAIRPIEEPKVQYLKATKHLYALDEAWTMIVPDMPDCVVDAERSGCGTPQVRGPEAHRWDRACDACRQCVCGHHDRYMRTAYMQAVHEPEATAALAAAKTAFVGHNGVFTLVSSSRAVLTAYRIGWRQGSGGQGDNRRFVLRALNYLRKKELEAARMSESSKNASQSSIARMISGLAVLSQLGAESQLPPDLDDEQAIQLLALLYLAKTCRHPPAELRTVLAAALRPAIVDSLRGRARFASEVQLIEGLRLELEDAEEPQGPLFDRLIDIEDTVAALAQTGEIATAERLARRTAALLTRYPARTVELMPAMQERLSRYESASALSPLWQAVVQESPREEPHTSMRTSIKQLLVQLLEQPLVATALQPRFAAHRAELVESGRDWFAVYEQKDHVVVHVLLPTGMKLRGEVKLRVMTAMREESLIVRTERVKPGEVWLDLGRADEVGKLLAPVRQQLGEQPVVSVHLDLQLEPESDADDSAG